MINKKISICAIIILLVSFSAHSQTKRKSDSRNVLDYLQTHGG